MSRPTRSLLAMLCSALLLAAGLALTVASPAVADCTTSGGPGGGTVGVGCHKKGHKGTDPTGPVTPPGPTWPITLTGKTTACMANALPGDPLWDVQCNGFRMTCKYRGGGLNWRIWTRLLYQDGHMTPWKYAGTRCISDTNPGPPPIDPGVAAQMVFAQMHFTNIDIGVVPEATPGRMGYIGLPAWVWAANPGPTSTQNQTVTKQVPENIPVGSGITPLTVTIDANFGGVTWNMGDGTTLTDCEGAGTPYSDSYGTADSPTNCSHRYGEPGSYTITATPKWTITYTADGDGVHETGDLDSPTGTTDATIRIGELQVLN